MKIIFLILLSYFYIPLVFMWSPNPFKCEQGLGKYAGIEVKEFPAAPLVFPNILEDLPVIGGDLDSLIAAVDPELPKE